MSEQIAVVCHDAGGAELASSWLRRNPQIRALAVVQGPAHGVFSRDGLPPSEMTMEEAIEKADWVLCGTSWQSDLERRAMTLARAQSKRVVAILDHWVNYVQRFAHEGSTVLPDEIWVFDAEAKTLATREFPTIPIHQHENPYFKDLSEQLSQLRQQRHLPSDRVSVLYICEPVSEHAQREYGDPRYYGYTEDEALRYFLSCLPKLLGRVDQVTIRPHPSETSEKYQWAISQAPIPIVMSRRGPLLEEIAESALVAGCESMAMVVALLANCRVISTIPPNGMPCRLPHAKIEHLSHLMPTVSGHAAYE